MWDTGFEQEKNLPYKKRQKTALWGQYPVVGRALGDPPMLFSLSSAL